jgi:hypothetical protein
MNWKKQWLKLKNKVGRLTQEDIDKYGEERIKQMVEEEEDWIQHYKEQEINNQFRYLETHDRGIKATEGKKDLFSMHNLNLHLNMRAITIVRLIDIYCGFKNKKHIVIHWNW